MNPVPATPVPPRRDPAPGWPGSSTVGVSVSYASHRPGGRACVAAGPTDFQIFANPNHPPLVLALQALASRFALEGPCDVVMRERLLADVVTGRPPTNLPKGAANVVELLRAGAVGVHTLDAPLVRLAASLAHPDASLLELPVRRDRLNVVCDASLLGDTGAFAWYLDDTRWRAKVVRRKVTDSHELELDAVIDAVSSAPRDQRLLVWSDSRFVVDGFAKLSVHPPRHHRPRFARLARVCAGRDVEVRWVPGHRGVPLQEMVDSLASCAAQHGVSAGPGFAA